MQSNTIGKLPQCVHCAVFEFVVFPENSLTCDLSGIMKRIFELRDQSLLEKKLCQINLKHILGLVFLWSSATWNTEWDNLFRKYSSVFFS